MARVYVYVRNGRGEVTGYASRRNKIIEGVVIELLAFDLPVTMQRPHFKAIWMHVFGKTSADYTREVHLFEERSGSHVVPPTAKQVVKRVRRRSSADSPLVREVRALLRVSVRSACNVAKLLYFVVTPSYIFVATANCGIELTQLPMVSWQSLLDSPLIFNRFIADLRSGVESLWRRGVFQLELKVQILPLTSDDFGFACSILTKFFSPTNSLNKP